MKSFKFFALALIASMSLLTACNGGAAEATDAENAAEANAGAVSYAVNTGESNITWMGSKLAYGHTGTIKLSEGSLAVENGLITAGNFIVDMKTMEETGQPDAEKAAKLIGHLSSPDFFDVEKYPTSKFEITGSSANATDSTTHTIKGNLTIKDVTKNIEFPAKVTIEGDNLTAVAGFVINRNDWGVTYGSGLSGAIGDNIIGDNIAYTVSLKGSKAAAAAAPVATESHEGHSH